MKKLLLSTALTGVILSTSAIAQTTVGGNMTAGLRATSEKGAAGAVSTQSKRGMLMETQVNIANKGKLNVGNLSYAAGFSLEFDANDQTSATKSIANENAYIDLISGNTTLSFGIDHMNDSDRTIVPVVGERNSPTGSQGGSQGTNAVGGTVNTSAAQGIALRQVMPGIGQITFGYSPTMSCNSTDTAGCGGADTTVVEGNEGSGYSYAIELADFGVKGLKAEYMYHEQQKKLGSTMSPTRDAEYLTYGFAYTTGPITIGANRTEYTEGKSTLEKNKQDDFGIAYTVGNLSYGALYGKVDTNLAGQVDEKMKSVAIGYNFGPVAGKVNVAKHENLAGSAGADADIITLKLSTNF